MSAVYTVFLTIGLLISGVCIPLILTFQDNQKIYVKQDDKTPDGEEFYYFNQPLLQTSMIFLGELICILIIHLVTKTPSMLDRSMLEAVQPHNSNSYSDYNEWTMPRTSTWSWSAAWFILPSACDLIATTLLNLGLIYTSPSVYQMMKSSIVGFSAIFSCLFLSRKFLGKEWVSISAILVGTLAIIGSVLYKDKFNYWGPIYLVVAQLFVAAQFILEEYLMDRFHLDPVRAMGIEGIFGTLLLSSALAITALFGQNVFDITQGLQDVFSSYVLWQSALLLAFMVAIFNFFGLAVSTTIGVPGRSMIDTSRTVLTWIIAVHYGWDSFSWLELIGFTVLVFGVFIFNGVFTSLKANVVGESTPLLS
ncbi:integral membrane protein [Mucor ambiguus]|uniref:Integral membrane protein n=1 Tax=Mucor ambiguus TaxID=91626 RepID=A0A0C9M699_9FUNG|nr:integral membrane protein [Mucor ambiguus]